MLDQGEVSLGELYRLCERIERQVIATNGRVTALEKDAIRIKAFWSAGAVAFAIFGGYIRSKLGL
jgi:hypothetical protein